MAENSKSLHNRWREAAALEERGPALLQEYLAATDDWFAGLRDRSYGPVGKEFIRRFDASGCVDGTFEANDDAKGMAGFKPFSLLINRETGTFFSNRIIYHADSLTGPEQFFLSRLHECIHAIQAARVPVSHANILNKATNIVLCPRDQIVLIERMEQDAYAKAAWLGSLACRDQPGIRHASRENIDSVAAFESIRKKSHDLQQALSLMAKRVMNSRIENPYARNLTAGEYYRDHALDTYALMLDNPQYIGGPLVAVRLAPEDIWAVGNSFGPNTFGKDSVHPDFLKPPRLTERQQRMLAALNDRLDIENEDKLPTLRRALRAQGLTIAEFMAQSRGNHKILQKHHLMEGFLP